MAISASFCDGGIYATSLYSPSYYAPLQKHFQSNELRIDKEIFKNKYLENSLTGAWKNELYIVDGHKLHIYSVSASSKKPVFKYLQTMEFQQWKGNLLSII